MVEGVVKWYSREKPYGFVRSDEGEETFIGSHELHLANINSLEAWDRVAYLIEHDRHGRTKASNITLLTRAGGEAA
jgi:cold shock CspA family protein